VEGKFPIAHLSGLLADPARVAILVTLLDGTSHPASELAAAANVTLPSASMHLAKLSEGRLTQVTRFGRHRYYRLAGPEVAAAIEALGTLANFVRPTRRAPDAPIPPLRIARTCYDHLAGELSVGICEALQSRKFLDKNTFMLNEAGEIFLSDLGLDFGAMKANRKRPLVRKCLDWTERKYHLAGSVGAALLDLFRRRSWLKRQPGSRLVKITEEGRHAFQEIFGVRIGGS
jgi:DNA-binding transcriptional ArsR family regulator